MATTEELAARLLSYRLEEDKRKLQKEVEHERTKLLDNQEQVKDLTNGAIKKVIYKMS